MDLFTEDPTIHVHYSLSRQINLDGGNKNTVRKLSNTKTNDSKRDIPIMTQFLDDFKKYMMPQIYLKKQISYFKTHYLENTNLKSFMINI